MASTSFSLKTFFVAALALLLASCGETPDVAVESREPLGDFKLGLAIVVAKNAEKGPLSRDATQQELESSMKAELERVFRGYQGSKFYNIAVSIDAYVLAMPGIPIIASPKSALVVSLNIWDDAKGERITEEHKQFTILEKITGSSFLLGSGLTLSREEQLAELTKSAVAEIDRWLHENEDVFTAQSTEANDS